VFELLTKRLLDKLREEALRRDASIEELVVEILL